MFPESSVVWHSVNLNLAMRVILFSIVVVGITFSYSIFGAVLPDFISNHMLLRMSLWTFAMLISYSGYARVKFKRIMPPSIPWRFQSKTSVFALLVVFLLMGLAILFPSPKHDQFDMLYIVVIAVIGEEMLFRGLLWDIITSTIGDKIFLGLPSTIWLTALAFGVMHLQYHHFRIHLASIVQLIYTFGVGVLLGMIRNRTQSVMPSMFAHSAFNSLFNLWLAALP